MLLRKFGFVWRPASNGRENEGKRLLLFAWLRVIWLRGKIETKIEEGNFFISSCVCFVCIFASVSLLLDIETDERSKKVFFSRKKKDEKWLFLPPAKFNYQNRFPILTGRQSKRQTFHKNLSSILWHNFVIVLQYQFETDLYLALYYFTHPVENLCRMN